MSNQARLTEAEYEAYQPHPTMMEHIERCRSGFGATRRDFRIVDWGCGRGKLVLWLLERGYDAVGVDIDPAPFANGAELFRARGHRVEECLHALDPRGMAPFPDSSFHFIASWQTLEHVRDLDGAAAEWSRLTMDGGRGFHIYPADRRVVEPHLFMPFVHWLPKNATRWWLIGAFVLIGVDPQWWPRRSVGWAEKTRGYYRFSVEETFYRSPRAVRECLAARGFETELISVDGVRSLRFVRNVGLATSYPRPSSSARSRRRAGTGGS